MDSIHYNPAENPLLAYDESSDEMDFDSTIEYGQIEMLVEFDPVPGPETQPVAMEEAVDDLVEEFKEVVITTRKKYKKYGEEQITRFISLVQETGLTVPKAAEQCGILRSTSYKLLDEFNTGSGTVLPESVKKQLKREPKKLFPEHSAFLIKLFDDNPSIVLAEAKQKLCEHFEGLEISIPGLYKHIREKCAISVEASN